MVKKKNKTWAERLLEVRTKAGISQRTLGIKAGIDQFAASARVNRYEKGIHEPDRRTAENIAKALGVPLALLYAEDDDLALIIETYACASVAKRARLVALAKELKPK